MQKGNRTPTADGVECVRSVDLCGNVRFAMKRYIALLRGINISGKNKISMPELKASFIKLGYADALTYLNSGNILFSASETGEILLAETIKAMIREQFDLDLPVLVLSQQALKDLLNKAPDWWGTGRKEIYDNLIFVMPCATAESIAEKIGEPTKELERISICENAIFWSFDRKNYAKAAWWQKTASAGIGELITIRTANTARKIAEL